MKYSLVQVVIVAFMAITLTGCFHNMMRPKPDYTLETIDGLAVTDSPSFEKRRFEKTETGGRLSYSMIVENTSDRAIALNIKNAFVRINEIQGSASCEIYKGTPSSGPFELQPQKQVRVDCTATVTPTVANKLAIKDSMAELQIPLGNGMKNLSFKYRLRIEDFE